MYDCLAASTVVPRTPNNTIALGKGISYSSHHSNQTVLDLTALVQDSSVPTRQQLSKSTSRK